MKLLRNTQPVRNKQPLTRVFCHLSKIFFLSLMTLAFSCQKEANPQPKSNDGFNLTDDWPAVTIGPEGRKAALYVNESQDSGALFVMLHGYGSGGEQTANFLNAKKSLANMGAHLLLPDGRINSQDKRYWDGTPACCEFEAKQSDIDEKYLKALINEAKEILGQKANSVTLVGYSNGSFMAQRFACRQSQLVNRVISFVGAGYETPADCRGTSDESQDPLAVGMIHIHGKWDPIVYYHGGILRAPYPSAPETVHTWAQLNGCELQAEELPRSIELSFEGVELQTTNPPRGLIDLPMETDLKRYKNCRAPTLLLTMQGLGHTPRYRPDILPYVYGLFEP